MRFELTKPADYAIRAMVALARAREANASAFARSPGLGAPPGAPPCRDHGGAAGCWRPAEGAPRGPPGGAPPPELPPPAADEAARAGAGRRRRWGVHDRAPPPRTPPAVPVVAPEAQTAPPPGPRARTSPPPPCRLGTDAPYARRIKGLT